MQLVWRLALLRWQRKQWLYCLSHELWLPEVLCWRQGKFGTRRRMAMVGVFLSLRVFPRSFYEMALWAMWWIVAVGLLPIATPSKAWT